MRGKRNVEIAVEEGVEDRGKIEHKTELCGDWGDSSADGNVLSVQA